MDVLLLFRKLVNSFLLNHGDNVAPTMDI